MQFFGGSEINPSPQVPTASGNNAHMMYVFNRNGVCLLYKEWNRPLHTLNPQQDHKLMFGLLFSLKSLTAKMDPVNAEKGNLGVPQLPGQGCSFHSFRTNTYKLSFMETPSGIKNVKSLIGVMCKNMGTKKINVKNQSVQTDEEHNVVVSSGKLRLYVRTLGSKKVNVETRVFRQMKNIILICLNKHKGQDVSWGIADCITKIILVTHPKTGDLRESLKYIYGLYVEYVVKNPIYNPGSPINAEKGNLGVPQLPGQGCSFHSFRTNTYKLSFMETPSGIKIILVTHPKTGDLRESLKYIYGLYVEYVVKNPIYNPGSPIKSELFNTALDQYVRSIS
ncbi:hypothetical protein F2Q68_00006762 [Brassica cretica]|uniref:Trafficking protein particle complex subunit n=1 Tax=Brassica cretica TaxID=69181 RepID=A0A8S9J8E1_BRACR|nr:hypothetical protein F2Q68_00006762 [Brassica cretica]